MFQLLREARPLRVASLLSLALLLTPLAACGGGGGGTDVAPVGPPGSVYGTLAEKPASSLDTGDLRHFLQRTHWGLTDATWERLNEIGLEAFVDEMLEFAPLGSTSFEQAAEARLVDAEDPVGQEGMFPSANDLIEWHLQLLMQNPNTFQEVLAFFWHDHFATSSEVLGGGNTYWMKNHINLFREKGAGNLKELVLDVSRDWAMLRWLDGVDSRKGAPNENYAREFFELFCLGVDNGYTQDDIVEAARAFTGYRQVTLDEETGLRGVIFDPNRHDAEDKTVLGVLIPGQNDQDDYAAVVDITFAEGHVAEWFARSILKTFCFENPPQRNIDELAQALRDADYELKPVLKRLFLSETFFSPKSQAGFVKGPLEFTVGFTRATSVYPVHGETLAMDMGTLRSRLTGMGHVPTRPPTVNGWPEGELWLSAQAMVDRANYVRDAIIDRNDQTNAGFDIRSLLPSPTPTADEVVDALATRLGLDLEEDERATALHYLDTRRLGDGMDEDDPFDPTNETHIEERVRGLLYILAQQPEYMIR